MTLHLVGPDVDERIGWDELAMALLDYRHGTVLTITVED